MATPDITENIPLNIGNPGTTSFWTNTAEDYDVAIGGEPFFLAPTDQNPYQRETAPYRKDQFDNGKEPGEQSLTGWWIRSQSSFHVGEGIKFYDPSSGETTPYRFADSKGVDVWTKGQVTLLKSCTPAHITTGALQSNKRSNQSLRSIQWDSSPGVLLHDEYDVDKISSTGVALDFINYNAGTDSPVYAICDDGTTAYWVTNTSTKLAMYKKDLSLDASTPVGLPMLTSPTITVTTAVMEYVKERIVACFDNLVYELSPAATSLPTNPVYTHPTATHVYTSIAASGPAIYIAGYNGIQSSIHMFTLLTSGTDAGTMPKLSSAIVAAEMPIGEIIHKIGYYLGYMIIGTSKGIRVAVVSDQDGSIKYGPLIVETTQPCYDFTFTDRFAWCATGVDGEPGLIRIDLGSEIEPLRFAYANDIYYPGLSGRQTTSCAFLDSTDELAFTTAAITAGTRITNKAKTAGGVVTLTTLTAHGLNVGDLVWIEGVDAVGGSVFNSTIDTFAVTGIPTTTTFTYTLAGAAVTSTAVTSLTAKANLPGATYIESTSTLLNTGYLTTGAIRYGTLEPKNFKFIRARGEYTNGGMDIQTIDETGNLYNIITYNASIGSPEAATTNPETPQEFISYKFTLSRSQSNTSLGPIFKGYQAKALPATKRQRLIQFPVWCFDVETDRYGVQTGYESRAWERIQLLENIEAAGDIVNIQDFTTGERVQGIIERVNFTRRTPPSGKFDGFGGLLSITVRTVL